MSYGFPWSKLIARYDDISLHAKFARRFDGYEWVIHGKYTGSSTDAVFIESLYQEKVDSLPVSTINQLRALNQMRGNFDLTAEHAAFYAMRKKENHDLSPIAPDGVVRNIIL